MLRPVKQKKIITPADLPFGHGDGVIESGAAGAAAKPLSCFIGNCSILRKKRNAPMGNIGARKKTNELKDKKTFNTGIVGKEIIFI